MRQSRSRRFRSGGGGHSGQRAGVDRRGRAWQPARLIADVLPAEVLERHPRALTFRAEVARLRGEHDKAQAMLRRAAALLQDQGDREGEAEALHSLATIARRQGDFAAAFEYLDRATGLSDEQSAVPSNAATRAGYACWRRAMGRGRAEFRAALQVAEERRDEHYARIILHNLGLPAMMRGDFGEALRWLRRRAATIGRNTAPMPQEAHAHLNVARCYLYRGDLEACERHLDRALERCQLFNLIEARAEVFETYGKLYRELGDLRAPGVLQARGARLRQGRRRSGALRVARRAGAAQTPVGRLRGRPQIDRSTDRCAPRASATKCAIGRRRSPWGACCLRKASTSWRAPNSSRRSILSPERAILL